MSRADRSPPASRVAIACLTAGVALIPVTGLLGPSAAAPPLPGGPGWLPPYSLGLHPSPWLVTGLLIVAALAGGAGLLLALRALAMGWSPDPDRLLLASLGAVVAVIAVPPMGSADHLVYAAYGRLAATGGDPYAQTAADLAARGDPVGRAVEAPWQHTPSLYGPLGTAEQWFASTLGGGSVHATVFVLQALGAVAFVVTGLLLRRLAADPAAVLPEDLAEDLAEDEAPRDRDRDRTAAARATLAWSLNPLLLFVIVNAAHVDGFGLVWAVAALVAVRRSAAGAGVLAGLAIAVKLSLGLYVLALAWALRRRPRALAAMLGAAGVVVAVGYAPIGLHGFDQLRAASRLVSFGSVWRPAVGPLEALLGADAARTVISLGGWALLAVGVWALAAALPPRGWFASGLLRSEDPAARAGAIQAATVLTFAWVLSAPYSLPWYDAAAWAPFALAYGSGLDPLLVVRTTVLTIAYTPGRVVPLPAALDALTRNLRGTLAPAVGLALVGLLIRAGVRARRPRPAATQPAAPPPAPSPRSR